MIRRMRWPNLVNLWKAFPQGLRPYFENRADGVTNYNQFLSTNMLNGQERIYLTKSHTRDFGCVLTSVTLAAGSLPPIATEWDNVGLLTNIALGSLTIASDTTVGSLSAAIIRNNFFYADGDRIRFYSATQQVDETGRPYVSILCQEMVLDLFDWRPLSLVVQASSGFASRNGRLAASDNPCGGRAWVHLRPSSDNRLLCSTQQLVCNNESIRNLFNTEEALLAAIDSYGGFTSRPTLQPAPTEAEQSRFRQ